MVWNVSTVCMRQSRFFLHARDLFTHVWRLGFGLRPHMVARNISVLAQLLDFVNAVGLCQTGLRSGILISPNPPDHCDRPVSV